jgi:hypothetical protein
LVLPEHPLTYYLQWRVFTDMGRELVQQGRHSEAERYFKKVDSHLGCASQLSGQIALYL